MAFVVTITIQNLNPGTIGNRLAQRLGREPSHAEAAAEVRRIMRDARTCPPASAIMRPWRPP